MRDKIKLTGLYADAYTHPEEKKMHMDGDFHLVTKGMDLLNDINVSVVKQITLGRHIEVTEKTAPRVKKILDDVCDILDYPNVPRIYICHQAAQTLFCAGTDRVQITVSDYIIDHFDDDMLYFAFGNLISMFKAGHVRLVTICSLMINSPQTLIFELPLYAYLRAADLSSDRGGLLACQNFAAAARVILWNAGIPIEEMSNKTEAEMVELSEAFIEAVEQTSPEWLTMGAAAWKKLNMESMPEAYKLKTLLEWYRTEYSQFVSQWQNQ